LGRSWINQAVSDADFITAERSVEVRPITPPQVDQAAQFLHRKLNVRLTPAMWAAAIRQPWRQEAPNHGFMLLADGRVVGVYVAFYSHRQIEGRIEKFCNLAAWCVLDQYRSHGLKLLRTILSQERYTFTDLSPSGNVVPLNARLNFRHLDTSTALVANLPWPGWLTRTRIISDPTSIEARLAGRDLQIYADHRHAMAACHLVVEHAGQYCYVIFRRDRRKNLPLFASILFISNPDLFRRTARHVYSHFLTKFGIVATLAERRVVGSYPRFAIPLRSPRPRMFRSPRLRDGEIDYLYSELTCVPW
jgi:hypothetical protein